MYLIEVDRVPRPGGYWILSGPPIRWKQYYKGWQRTEEDLKQEQDEIEDLASRLCWKKVVEEGDLAIWQKPINHAECIKDRNIHRNPPICDNNDPDSAWYKKMDTCITPLPEVNSPTDSAGRGGALEKWPQRATSVPPRIRTGSVPGITPKIFQDDTKLWEDRANNYKKLIPPLAKGRFCNIMDMNVVPTGIGKDALGIIYERGFIGTYQDWCQAFSTYPRTYDLIHADSVLSIYQDR
ncbi:S-adenosyl-L-methionine-dependent methyltransferases superfamily protein [Rhynchospora pubera]|uniref:Methyltransferase n=1 Tax=Rhynchospora pubera TaxID=906938 RepID=A0AAV8E520_9POAL|nr:S-adenosyl-L-methionine-dependent methyltransferases superfamily protein [Rhynchospora pubera]